MDLFKIVGRIAIEGADEARNELTNTENQAEQSSSKMGAAFSKIGDAAVKVGSFIVKGLAAGATGISFLTKSAIDAYADYEQLVGGVETLFKDSSSKVVEYANNAYKTAGLSANDYMETVTSFSASLLQGLGGDTDTAAEIANQAIVDMSDNANKMGTSMEMIQNAYQGFAKQNYTMLDNLKLGYGGTASEMARLINDSGVLGDTMTVTANNVNEVSFDKMIEAIHVIQTEMDITGTTSLEASTTIQGSMSSLKASWTNVLVGLADDTQDFGALLDTLSENFVTVVGNVLPRVQTVFNAIPKLIEGLLPQVPGLVQSILPGLLEGAIALMNGLVGVLPQLIQIIVDNLPLFIDGFMQIFTGLVENLPSIVAPLISALPEIATEIVDGLFNNVSPAVQTFTNLIGIAATAFAGFKAGMAIQSVVQGFQKAQVALSLFSMQSGSANIAQAALNGTLSIGETITALLTGKMTLAQLAQAGMAKAQAALNAVMSANPIALVVTGVAALIAIVVVLYNNCEWFRNMVNSLWEWLKTTFSSLVEWFKTTLSAFGEWFNTTIQSISDFFTNTWNSITTFLSSAWETIKNVIQVALLFIEELFNGFIEIIMIPWNFIWENFGTVLTEKWEAMKQYVSDALNAISETITNVMNAIKATWDSIWTAISNFLTPIFTAISNFISSTLDAIKQKWNAIWTAVSTFLSTKINEIKTSISSTFNSIKSTIDTVMNGVKTVISNIWNAIKTFISNTINSIKNTVSNVFNSIKTAIETPLNNAKATVSNIFNSIKDGISQKINAAKDVVKSAIDKIKSFFNFSWSLPKLKLPHISIKGEFSLTPPKVPSFGIDWYAKGGILTEPTIFGFNPETGKAQVGGEAGDEAVAPIDTLLGYIRTAVAEQNTGLADSIDNLIAMLAEYLPQILNKDSQLVLDTGVLVGHTARAMNEELGNIYTRNGRGG